MKTAVLRSRPFARILTLLVVNSICFSVSASADEKTQPTLDVRQVELKQGDKAPFAGRLLTHDAVAKLIADYKAKIAELEAQLNNHKKLYEMKLKAEVEASNIKEKASLEKVASVNRSCSLEKDLLNKAVDRTAQQCSRKWYESPWLPFVGGVLLCGGGVAAGAALK